MFNLTFEIEGIDDLERKVEQAERDLSSGVARGIQAGIDAGIAEAKGSHPYTDRTHQLTDSIGGDIESEGPSGTEGYLEATAPYAAFVEEGTDEHDIEASDGGVLHWVSGGQDHFARRVHHPGTEPRPFMRPAAQVAGETAQAAIEQSIDELASKFGG